MSPDDANPWVDIVIPTDLHYGRNALLIAMVDAVVVVGAAGTLSEVALAWQYEKVVVALLGVGGASVTPDRSRLPETRPGLRR